MANFEALIKSALASQNAKSPEVRETIYQSSRNALQRIIDNNRSMTVEMAMEERKVLEDSIARIEQEIIAPPPPPEPKEPPKSTPEEKPSLVPEQVKMYEPVPVPPKQEAEPTSLGENDPLYEIGQIMTGDDERPVVPSPEYDPLADFDEPTQIAPENEISHEYRPFDVSGLTENNTTPSQEEAPDELAADLYVADTMDGETIPETVNLEETSDVPVGFSQRRRKQKIAGWLIGILVFVGLIAWGGNELYKGIQDGTLLGFDQDAEKNRNGVNNNTNAADYITILSPSDLSSLIVAGRGSAGIITKQNTQMIRISSLRDKNNRQTPAQPILFRLKPGVLEQISNKRVTVEIFAKSDTNEQAQFSVSCQFANGSNCGRKRFVAGVQPQASVFELDFGAVTDSSQDYYIAINTDTTSDAAISGEGDMIDIVYVRLKPSDNQ